MKTPNRRARVADAKAKRQKITIIAGSCILALVLAIQVPKMMSLLSPGGEQASAAAAPETTTASQTQATPAPVPTGASAPMASTAASATPVSVGADEKAPKTPTFDSFASKDPFAPQMTTTESAAAASSSSSSSAGGTSPSPRSGGLTPASIPSSGSPSPSAGQPPAPSAAVIAVNGVPSTVAVGATFPATDPVFKLMKLGTSVAKVAIADGSYTSGAQAVSLPLHGSLTLLNTATGARYKLQFVSFAP